jgi:hypothetical protein
MCGDVLPARRPTAQCGAAAAGGAPLSRPFLHGEVKSSLWKVSADVHAEYERLSGLADAGPAGAPGAAGAPAAPTAFNPEMAVEEPL